MENKEFTNFIHDIIDEDNESGKHGGRVQTRFPPEPNGYLHIGHAKSICLNFGTAIKYGGKCNLRFDDTNPSKEEDEYVRSIREDVHWLGFDWAEREFYASDYFEELYEFAVELIKLGKAYVCELSATEIREFHGTLKEPGKPSPWRERSIEENLELFERMRSGEFEEGKYTLRAKIDMSSPNMHMRDPVIYRIMYAHHHRTGNKWCIYPMYDFTHCLSDSLERITHSLCTLEFEVHRPLYDWFLDELEVFHSRQIEFARLNLTYTVMSKRKLLMLVKEGYVSGWDDPRMPTICGLRRRGYTPESIREFCDRIGVAKRDSMVDLALLEHCLRDHLNKIAPRYMAVLNPLKVIIDNYPADKTEYLEAINNPEDPDAGSRMVPFSREIYIEREDFMEDAPKKFYRLTPGSEVRLRYAYFIQCENVVKDAEGNILEIHCTYDPASSGGNSPDGRKVKATLHWVSIPTAFKAEVRHFDNLLTVSDPATEDKDFLELINKDSLHILENCPMEPALKDLKAGERIQFERIGYYCVDSKDSAPEKPVFNRTVGLKDEWARMQNR
ncbi:MAG: glutamine--tRNA ligase/YqeY domain fusion protein [Candidatus Cloacimonetes bacterium]|nr:glutamine--tRNA ligase/YqeY domain fusion protein [Candidatus Cloacimonadota bacterium]